MGGAVPPETLTVKSITDPQLYVPQGLSGNVTLLPSCCITLILVAPFKAVVGKFTVKESGASHGAAPGTPEEEPIDSPA